MFAFSHSVHWWSTVIFLPKGGISSASWSLAFPLLESGPDGLMRRAQWTTLCKKQTTKRMSDVTNAYMKENVE